MRDCVDCATRPKARGMCSKHYNAWYYAQNPERHRERAMQWYRKNPERAAAARARRDPALMRQGTRRWYRANRLRAIAHAANYKARDLGRAGRLTADGIAARFAFFGNRCWVCGTDGDMTVDHVIPFGRGGLNLHSNIRPACLSCNTSKAWEARGR